jgi:L-gulonolactone oxidase
MKQIVCVTGGSGGIGRALLEQLVGRFEVKALFRGATPAADAWRQRGCTIVPGDLADAPAVEELVRGADYVFHCAALTAQAKYEDSYAVNVEGTRRLAEAAARAGCRRFVHLSSIAVYSGTQSLDGDCSEDLALDLHPEMAAYAQTKLAGEQALVAVAQATGLDYAILRPTSVYGPYTKPYTIVAIELVRKGLPVILGDGTGLIDVVYVDDVASAMIQAAEAPAASREIFNIGHESVALNEFYAHFGRMLDRPVRHVPLRLVRTIQKMLTILPGAAKPSRDQLRRGVAHLVKSATNTKRFPSSKAAAGFRYQPANNLALGMLQTELWAKRELGIAKPKQSVAGYGPLPFRPAAVFHPASEAEIVQAVRTAAANHVRVRAIGSLHSFSPIAHTDGVCLVLDRYRDALAIDGTLVTVQAGMTLRELFDTLGAARLALPANGSITAQTVSGAIATATHGGSIVHASIADAVDGLRIIKANGTVTELRRGDEAFAAAVASFGLLGIVSTVTFKCVPAFTLAARREVRTAQEVIDRFDDIQRQSPHTCICYFPVVDRMEILSIDGVSGDAERSPSAVSPSMAGARATQSPLRQHLSSAALKSFAAIVGRSRALHRVLVSRGVGKTYPLRTGRSDRVLAISDVPGTSARSPQILQDMEVAVPYEQAPAALAALRHHFQSTNRFPLLSIHIRCSAGSDLWLSPAYQRPVCYLEFWKLSADDDLFDRVHALLAPFGYRFHWGKEMRADREYIRRQYPRWDDFVRLRAGWDPQGMFLNAYTAPLFAGEPPTAPLPQSDPRYTHSSAP